MYKDAVTMQTASQAHHTTAAIWFRFASPKFLLHCVPQKLHIAANVVGKLKNGIAFINENYQIIILIGLDKL